MLQIFDSPTKVSEPCQLYRLNQIIAGVVTTTLNLPVASTFGEQS
ncbi:hypothetical protein APA_2635 [Pseudanabaena sp. lw0831]|nr:hypothetical protein APA_2635 [Pseudanabaena sp. lw0831]